MNHRLLAIAFVSLIWSSQGQQASMLPGTQPFTLEGDLSAQMVQSYQNNTIHLGLSGMHHRIEDLGGQFLLANGEEGGLIVKAVIPL